ncbi:hypothetical protein MATL_G00227350 [Megalops atlanticus]|uniref:WH2 domain-containing protein n=1 Tax=Megalops atlanticus TaxID=7932 RepID=A0A9D3T1Z3_MEGAT|nr:hypothetical protein MATL_G00227350 [Megalops atlanticus]
MSAQAAGQADVGCEFLHRVTIVLIVNNKPNWKGHSKRSPSEGRAREEPDPALKQRPIRRTPEENAMPVPPPTPTCTTPPSPTLLCWTSDPPRPQAVEGGGRNALLADIQRGARLRKVTQVNDRSAPLIDKPKAGSAEAVGGTAVPPPSLGGLFAGGFPVLRPAGQRDSAPTASRSGSSPGPRQPLWSPPVADSGHGSSLQSLRAAERGPARVVASAPTTPTFNKPSTPPPLQDRPINPKPPPAPSGPPPAPPSQTTKPTWLPVQSHPLPQPSTLPPPPPASSAPDRSSGFFFPPPPPPILSDSKFNSFRESQVAPIPPPPPPLPVSFTPISSSSLPPPPPQPPPQSPPVPSPALRSGVPPLPPSYPCTAPSRRPPAVPRPAGGRLAPPPAPPTRSPTTELSCRTPPPPPPPPPALRNGHLHSLDDFESKFQFHPIDDFPPPDEFKPFPRTYPSKEARANPRGPALRTHMR